MNAHNIGRDIHNQLDYLVAVKITTQSNNNARSGQIIDFQGGTIQGETGVWRGPWYAVEFVLITTDAAPGTDASTVSCVLNLSNDPAMAGAVAAPAAQLIGALPTGVVLGTAGGNQSGIPKKWGFNILGAQPYRYGQVLVTTAGNSASQTAGVLMAFRGHRLPPS